VGHWALRGGALSLILKEIHTFYRSLRSARHVRASVFPFNATIQRIQGIQGIHRA